MSTKTWWSWTGTREYAHGRAMNCRGTSRCLPTPPHLCRMLLRCQSRPVLSTTTVQGGLQGMQRDGTNVGMQ